MRGPGGEHDLDFMVKPEDAEGALNALEEAGFRPEKPPEEWLYKAWDGDLLIDLIFAPNGRPVEDAMFERADELEVQAVSMKVMSLEEVMATKLLALREHEVDYDSVLGDREVVARADRLGRRVAARLRLPVCAGVLPSRRGAGDPRQRGGYSVGKGRSHTAEPWLVSKLIAVP
jgi:hypothetical protein